MRAANTTAAVAIALWLGLAMLGRASLTDFLVDDVPDWPSMTSIDFSVVLPMALATSLLIFAWVCNALGRWPLALAMASVGCLGAILPYLIVLGGGV